MVVEIDRLGGFDLDGPADQFDGPRRLAALMGQDPQQMQGIGMPRLHFQDFQIEGLCLRQLALLMQGQGLLQGGLDLRRSGR